MINEEAIRRTSFVVGLLCAVITALLVWLLWLSPQMDRYGAVLSDNLFYEMQAERDDAIADVIKECLGSQINLGFEAMEAACVVNIEQYARQRTNRALVITVLLSLMAYVLGSVPTRYVLRGFIINSSDTKSHSRSKIGGIIIIISILGVIAIAYMNSGAKNNIGHDQHADMPNINSTFAEQQVLEERKQLDALDTSGRVSETGTPDIEDEVASIEATNKDTRNSEFMLNDSSIRYLTENELMRLNSSELHLARNEIFARHGYRFNDVLLQQYFNNKAWYSARSDFNVNELSGIERHNIEAIKGRESTINSGLEVKGLGVSIETKPPNISPTRISFQKGSVTGAWQGDIFNGTKTFILRLSASQHLSLNSGDVYTWSAVSPAGKKLSCRDNTYCSPSIDSLTLPETGDYIITTDYRMSDCANCPVASSRYVNVKFVASNASTAIDMSDTVNDETVTKYVIILGSDSNYETILRKAKTISMQTGVQYCSRGMIYDVNRGLIWPDNDDDEGWAGRYAPRRYNEEECENKTGKGAITVERSDGYKGFTKGLYIVVGGIYDEAKSASDTSNKFKRVIPDAYYKKAPIYMGCVH